MSTLTFRCKIKGNLRLDMSWLSNIDASNLNMLSKKNIMYGNKMHSISKLFSISGTDCNNIKILKSSSFYESLSWPNPKNPKFLNIVIKVSTNLKPLNLLKICKKIEINLGRKKSYKNSPRECDIDIIDFKKMTKNAGISLPHARMHVRNFVIIPLFEICKDWTHPSTKRQIKTLILSLPNRDIRSIKQI